jgi:preprotein translocase subunit SecD/SecD/SecF fusion protein
VLYILVGLNATLTLPGVAGLILSIGMAVDANVIIFERLKEELRNGKTIRSSIDSGFSKALRTILDSNITTFIAAIVLYYFGLGPIKGFAITLMIGILSSMFTAVFITKLLLKLTVGMDIIKSPKLFGA